MVAVTRPRASVAASRPGPAAPGGRPTTGSRPPTTTTDAPRANPAAGSSRSGPARSRRRRPPPRWPPPGRAPAGTGPGGGRCRRRGGRAARLGRRRAGRWGPGGPAAHDRGPEVGEQAQGGVVRGQALGVAQQALAQAEGPHGHRGHSQVGERRLLRGADDQPGGGGGQAHRARSVTTPSAWAPSRRAGRSGEPAGAASRRHRRSWPHRLAAGSSAGSSATARSAAQPGDRVGEVGGVHLGGGLRGGGPAQRCGDSEVAGRRR